MFVRISAFCLAAVCLAAFASGCKKSSPEQPAEHRSEQSAPESAGQSEIIARIHWLGMKQIAAESNAASFMTVWNLPESRTLESQTLDKFALAPWGLPRRGTNTAAIVATNAPSRLLRPLLDDLVQQESYLEVSGSTNQPGQATLAIRLDNQRSALWQTNLAAALETLAGTHAIPSADSNPGWRLETPYPPSQPTNNQTTATNYVTFQRVQDWTLVAFGPAQNPLLAKFASAVQKNGIPFAPRMTNFWLETDLNLPALVSAFSLPSALPDNFPSVTLSVIGHGADLRTVADLKFAKPLRASIEPWEVPTNLVHAPLSSFTAVRGVRDWLASSEIWKTLQLGDPPNQAYFWAQGSAPILSFSAIPLVDASNRVHQLAERLVQEGNPWLATNGMGRFGRTTNIEGVVWDKLPFLQPYLQAVGSTNKDLLLAGLGPFPLTNRPAPEALLAQFMSYTNLLCYDWELTGQRVEPWLYISQFFRFVLRKPQVPPDSISVAWLNAIPPSLGNCGTTIALKGADELSIIRNSTIGLSAPELQLLSDWLECPQFPFGLNTFTGPPPPPPGLPVPHRGKANTASFPETPK